jgi:geranylgeranyl diphosphate synthase, type II
MEFGQRIETTLQISLCRATESGCPPQLAAALRHAVFPGGARVRPRLCLAVAHACGDGDPALADSAAAAIELMHCASLVHDDLPCFDDADTRRGKPSVHKAFGQPLAVLTGDALIVASFALLARSIADSPARAGGLISIIAGSVGAPTGIVAGQAWECEAEIPLATYHRAKTGSLFAAATVAGALASGGAPEQWRLLGERLGEAYQIADDICDMVADPNEMGKPGGRDSDLDRPNAAGQLGLAGAVRHLKSLLNEAIESVPACTGAEELRAHIANSARPYLPKEISLIAA